MPSTEKAATFKLPGHLTLTDLYYMMTGAALAIEDPSRIADGLAIMPMSLRMTAGLILEENGVPIPSPKL